MRLPNTAHTSRPWRIHGLVPDFRLEDVWSLPTPGGPHDFSRLVDGLASSDPSESSSHIARLLWALRWKVGELLGWDKPERGVGSRVRTLRERMPPDLRQHPGPEFKGAPFSSLYQLGDELAAEIANETVHGVLHLGWVADGPRSYRGQMAVLVKPNGLLGEAYLAAIRPFRHLFVYPALIGQIERTWPASTARPKLPPGQRAVDGFPRFGTHLHRPAPTVPADPSIEVTGAVVERTTVPVADLAELPRTELLADFHCVSGWSATDLHWEGVSFADFYARVIRPALTPEDTVTHLVFEGLDGYRSVVTIEDALAEQVLVADRLNGRPLSSDHGAPVRLVSPHQYGFVSTKHLCRIEVHTAEPQENYGHPAPLAKLFLRGPLFQRHPRSRVWKEERHAILPGRALRRLYRPLIRPIAFLSARGGENATTREGRSR
jgi:DMSO/TMAO reductase YedYZ molybdopterin-dependent catalytic subunit